MWDKWGVGNTKGLKEAMIEIKEQREDLQER